MVFNFHRALFLWSSHEPSRPAIAFLPGAGQQREEGGVKTEAEIKSKITELEKSYSHVLTGSYATVQVNAARALEQMGVETKLTALHWVLGTTYISKLKGYNR